MTRPVEATHRPGCEALMKPAEHVGSWLIARCRGCGAVQIRPATPSPTLTQETTHGNL